MTRLKKASIFLFLMIVMSSVGSVGVNAQGGTPDCECDDVWDVGTPEFLDCEANGCTGVDVPVSGNVWLLALAGFVFAFVKFGAHTKLAGYYYGNRQEKI